MRIADAVGPLRMVFWGGIICVFDLKINNFDLFHDSVGMLLIAIGVFKLSAYSDEDRFPSYMTFCKIVALCCCIEALPIQWPSELSFAFMLLGLAAMIATVLFCISMRQLCGEHQLDSAESSWRTTTTLFTVIYLIPLGLFYIAAFFAILTGSSFHINLGPFGLILIPVFFWPFIHLFISTSRMKSEAELSWA